jgi:hypothetical protein
MRDLLNHINTEFEKLFFQKDREKFDALDAQIQPITKQAKEVIPDNHSTLKLLDIIRAQEQQGWTKKDRAIKKFETFQDLLIAACPPISSKDSQNLVNFLQGAPFRTKFNSLSVTHLYALALTADASR